jgi:hypothetical protein
MVFILVVGILVFGATAGALLGLRQYAVFGLLPVILVVALGAMAIGFASGYGSGAIVLVLVAAAAFPQLGYLMIWVAKAYRRSPTLPRAAQIAIGEELRTAFQLPEQLPPDMAEVVARIIEKEDVAG